LRFRACLTVPSCRDTDMAFRVVADDLAPVGMAVPAGASVLGGPRIGAPSLDNDDAVNFDGQPRNQPDPRTPSEHVAWTMHGQRLFSRLLGYVIEKIGAPEMIRRSNLCLRRTEVYWYVRRFLRNFFSIRPGTLCDQRQIYRGISGTSRSTAQRDIDPNGATGAGLPDGSLGSKYLILHQSAPS